MRITTVNQTTCSPIPTHRSYPPFSLPHFFSFFQHLATYLNHPKIPNRSTFLSPWWANWYFMKDQTQIHSYNNNMVIDVNPYTIFTHIHEEINIHKKCAYVSVCERGRGVNSYFCSRDWSFPLCNWSISSHPNKNLIVTVQHVTLVWFKHFFVHHVTHSLA